MCFSDKHRAFPNTGFFKLKIKEGKEAERESWDDHLPVGRKPDVACSPPVVPGHLPGSACDRVPGPPAWGPALQPPGFHGTSLFSSSPQCFAARRDYLVSSCPSGATSIEPAEGSAFYLAIPLLFRRVCVSEGVAGGSENASDLALRRGKN